jgi:hypothetical protein
MILYAYKNIWDKISIVASIACAIHCVALPIFFTTLPFLGADIIENIWIELSTIAISLVIGGWSIVSSYIQYHRNKYILFGFFIGVSILILSNVVNTEWIEIACKIIGAAILITTHIYNWKKTKYCSICK